MTVVVIVAVVAFTDLVVVTTLIRSFIAPLRELARQFPPQPPSADAVRRRFQSFHFGLFNAGWGIHVAADERFLHLSPAWIERVFRMRPLSIPWSSIQLVRRGTRTTSVRLESPSEQMVVKGPTWCLELASETGTTPQASPPR